MLYYIFVNINQNKEEFKMTYMEKIKQIRQTRKYTQQMIAKRLNISQQQYQKYEIGINELPIRYLIEICKILCVSSDYILGLKDEE